MSLRVDGLSFAYNGQSVIEAIGFAVKPGELLAVLGPNGVGKTTLLRCICAMLKPKGGAVFVEGGDVTRMRREEIAKHLGYVAQRGETGRMTAYDAVLLGRMPHMGLRPSRRDLCLVDAALRQVGLSHLALRPIDSMSGGEFQRVCIARALVQEPRVLLLDEPTSSLDLRNQIGILDTLRGIIRGHGVAAVMTMHDLNTALRYADAFLFVREGRVHALCGRDDVCARVVEDVYGVPVDIIHHQGLPVVLPRNRTPTEEPWPAP
jgi:iron complex transport system ATP-binding protein